MSEIKNITNIFNFKKTEVSIQKSCVHYKNNVQIYAKCCNKYVDCRLCHNNENDHQIVYDQNKKTKCTNCSTEDDNVSSHCKNCNINFGNYHCKRCMIWCSKIKDAYHCDKCKSCRIGDPDNYYHCDGCNICLSISCIDKHKCKKIDENDDCPICLNKLNGYDEKIIILKCSHLIHDSCLNNLIKNTDKRKKIPGCTLCKRSVVNFKNYEETYDNFCRESNMPSYYQNWKNDISCNDCFTKSTVKYHNIYNKCYNCRSYNTTVINTIKE